MVVLDSLSRHVWSIALESQGSGSFCEWAKVVVEKVDVAFII